MRQPQYTSRCSHDMTASRAFNFWCLTLLITTLLFVSEVNGNAFARRRQALKTSKKSVEETTDSSVSVPDQIALAATDNQRRKDYGYEYNLVRPEKEPRLHTQITAKYSTSITSDKNTPSSLEEAETAEEYVAKAVQRFGSRLKEPIRIEPETEKPTPNTGSSNYDRNQLFESSNAALYDSTANLNQLPNSQQSLNQELQSDVTDDARAYFEAEAQQRQQAQLQQAQEQQVLLEQVSEHPNVVTQFDQTSLNYGSDQQKAYRIYEDEAENATPIERTYRTKHTYQPSYRASSSDQSVDNEKIRVSASTEIPKAEIMKQIEKSVIKYMQELEAEGKIITAPKEPKAYYKLVTVPADEKRISTTTTRPKYISSASSAGYHASTSPAPYEKATRYIAPKLAHKQSSHTDGSSNSYQTTPSSKKETNDGFGSNVEFVYKIKTRAPLQTATVKTVSKPYSLPLKTSSNHFDHSAVLKNLEEFDLSHVVTAKDLEERSPSTSKPAKLYFNSEIHQDINSLPYKAEKTRLAAAEYRKQQETHSQPEYKGYSGYFAEPAPLENERETDTDDGYPVMNPYQYVLKKEPLPSKYEDLPDNLDQSRGPSKAHYSTITAQKALEYENSFGPKYNSDTDSYGYPIAYKTERERDPVHVVYKHSPRHAPGKRGKRGGSHHPQVIKKGGSRNPSKDIEASLALRPPPKA